ncbi:DegT/DnrJ/EryC1/StrS family aminotransferase [Desulfobacter latus]|uniref:DegT/DnrJ/EryC1/StrS family aminotransferase n=1 Tax=Desulfobacter latus TaxID=2292 RepID=A0A850T1L0_9BACT|nr:DegT/DnrJ/EryC1/StrS family aminotransferase [Desulfobacter latus]NWH04981.1 DegT/DnrJ/EryC1/StrS family aminotransferase [Desulfobacter latus]
MWKIPLFDLNYDDQELKAVSDVLKNKWLTAGEKTAAFEDKFGRYLGGSVHCCAVSSGTAALHLALLSRDIGPGDEVIISGLTFVADLNVVVLTGARPVLADIKSLDDWNIDPRAIKIKITDKTKAVIVVHYAGWPCDMDEIRQLCKSNNLLLIEDAAHAPGATYKDLKCGTIGDIGCFSFFSNKNLSTGEGGMVTASAPELIRKIKLMRSHGMTSMTIDRHHGRAISYDVVLPGLNYRIDEIKSALGIVQLKKLDQANEKRGKIVAAYIKHLEKIKDVKIPWKNPAGDRISSWHIFPILLKKENLRIQFMDALKFKGIQTSIHYPAMNDFNYYKGIMNQPVDTADEVSRKMVTLPLFPGMTGDDVDMICNEIKHFFMNR